MTDESWTLVIDINITNYHQALNAILNHVHQIETHMPTSSTRPWSKAASNALQAGKNLILARIYKLQKEIEEIEDSIEPYSEPRRNRRGLFNVAGSGITFLFGNPDNRDLEELNAKLEGISAQQQKFVTVVKAEATIINTTFEMARSNRRLIDSLRGASSELTKEFTWLEAQVKTEVNEVLTRLCILEYDIRVRALLRTTEAMLNVIENEIMQTTIGVEQAAKHKLRLHFVNAQEMIEMLTDIQPHLQDGIGYVATLHPHHIFKL